MTELRKLVTDGMNKSTPPFAPPPPPDLPPHLRLAVDTVKAALRDAKTAAARRAAERQGEEVISLLAMHVASLRAEAAIKTAHLKPLRFP